MKNKYKHNPQQSCDESWRCTKCHYPVDVDGDWGKCSVPDEVDQKSLDKNTKPKKPCYTCESSPCECLDEAFDNPNEQLDKLVNQAKQITKKCWKETIPSPLEEIKDIELCGTNSKSIVILADKLNEIIDVVNS